MKDGGAPPVQDVVLGDREGRRGTASLVLSVAAVLASVVSFVFPIASSATTESSVAERYLRAIVASDPVGPYTARGVAAEGSQADVYARTLGLLWEALVDAEFDYEPISNGSVTGGFGTYTVCFPEIDVFAPSCSQFADFEFSEHNRVSRFTIDGQPVEQLYRTGDSSTMSTEDDSWQMRAYVAGYFRDPDSSAKVIVLWFDRPEVAEPNYEDITFGSLLALDSSEEAVDSVEHFPTKVSYFDSYYAVVRVPESARFFWVCWDGVPAEEESCDYVNGIK